MPAFCYGVAFRSGRREVVVLAVRSGRGDRGEWIDFDFGFAPDPGLAIHDDSALADLLDENYVKVTMRFMASQLNWKQLISAIRPPGVDHFSASDLVGRRCFADAHIVLGKPVVKDFAPLTKVKVVT